MNIEHILQLLFLAVFAFAIGSFIYKIVRHGGFRAAMFQAPIERTVGGVSGVGARLISVDMKVHKPNGGTEKAVGVDLVAKSFASYQMMPITLSVTETKNLIMPLESAVRAPATRSIS